MSFDVSVIVLTYFPDRDKLITTLKSVLMQKKVSYEILIADDGSENFFQNDIEEIMRRYNFTDFKFVTHSKNQGTVINFYDAVKEAKGNVIKPISPGDYLYGEDTLSKVYSFMNENEADVAFGDLVYYSNENKFTVFDKKEPICDEPYFCYKNYNSKKIAKRLIKYSDSICGASLFYKSSVLREGLSKIVGTVIYAEDSITQMFALLGKKILKINDFVAFYEYGTGISTNKAFGSNRMLEDFLRFYVLLNKTFPKNSNIKSAIKKFGLIKNNKKIQYYLYRLTQADNNLYSIKQKMVLRKYQCVNYSLDFFNEINSR
ncbi:MAG: glycosyltransferase family 2 protein [Clostridia bacterium]|nr:glycosyltransferase family 2 protein [Clostridia bacterium]